MLVANPVGSYATKQSDEGMITMQNGSRFHDVTPTRYRRIKAKLQAIAAKLQAIAAKGGAR